MIDRSIHIIVSSDYEGTNGASSITVSLPFLNERGTQQCFMNECVSGQEQGLDEQEVEIDIHPSRMNH